MVKQKRYHQSSYAARGTAAICPIINSTQGIATLLPSALYRAESDALGIFVQPSRKPCSLSHSRGVRRRMSRPLRTGWMELRELPEVPFWSVPHRSPFSLALRQSNPATSMTRSVASLYCRALCVLTTSPSLNASTRWRL